MRLEISLVIVDFKIFSLWNLSPTLFDLLNPILLFFILFLGKHRLGSEKSASHFIKFYKVYKGPGRENQTPESTELGS